jgi:spore coat protein CotH
MSGQKNGILKLLGFCLMFGGCGSPSHPETDTTGDTNSESETDTASETEYDSESDTVVDSFTIVDVSKAGEVPFDTENILEYHILMDPALYEEMQELGDDEEYREASVLVRGSDLQEDYAKVGIRYKGDYSLHHCWDEHGGVRYYGGDCAKLSIRIKFNEYNKDNRFFGLKNINLHAMAADETQLRERLAYSVFNEFGVKTVRTQHAKLVINDEDPVLVLAVEQIDGTYGAYRYPDGGNGNLYEDSWPMSSLSEEALLSQLRTNNDVEDTPDVSDFIDFGNAVQAADESTFIDDMAEFIDLDNVLRYMAVDRAFKNWDGITAFYWEDHPHNYYWYHDNGALNRFHLIPWDMDKTMWEEDPYMDPVNYIADRQVPDWNVLPLSCDRIYVWNSSITVMPPGCDYFMQLLASSLWDDFVTVGNELLDTSLKYDAMNEKITAWAEQIAPVVAEDPFLDPTRWEADVENFRTTLKGAIAHFEEHLAEGYTVEE